MKAHYQALLSNTSPPIPHTPAFIKTCTDLPRQPPAIAFIKYSRIVFSFLSDWNFNTWKYLNLSFSSTGEDIFTSFQKAMLTIHYSSICSFVTLTRYSRSLLINFAIGNSALELFARVICHLQLSRHRLSQLEADKDKARPCLYWSYRSVNTSCGFLFCFQLQVWWLCSHADKWTPTHIRSGN